MTLEELLEENEAGTIFEIKKLPNGVIQVITKWKDGMKVKGKGNTIQEALDDEE